MSHEEMRMNEPHQYSAEEIRNLFLDQVWDCVGYWHNLHGKSKREALEGLAASILTMLDGGVPDLPAFHVLPIASPADQRDARAHGENWFPILHIESDNDIAGELHSVFFKRQSRRATMSTSGPSPMFLALKFGAFGFSFEEIDQLVDRCEREAKSSALSAETIFLSIYYQLLNGQTTRERLLQDMEHIITITTRQLQEIDFAMLYAEQFHHGTPSHNHLMLVATLAEGIGFYRNGDGKLEIPQRVRVDDGPQTSQQVAR